MGRENHPISTRVANKIVSSRLNCSQEYVKSESAAYWSAIDEILQGEVQGEVRAEGEKVYSATVPSGALMVVHLPITQACFFCTMIRKFVIQWLSESCVSAKFV